MERILIVEDERFIRQGLKVIIQRSGYCTGEIIECKDGLEALDAVQKHSFDLVITDIKMEKMDGLQFIKCLKELNIKLHIVVISGYDEFEYAVEAMRNGASDYLLKPVEREVLCKLLCKVDEEINGERTSNVEIKDQSFSYADKKDKIESAVNYINKNYKADINMAFVSNRVSMNYTYFSESFSEIMGMGFADYVKLVRVNAAKKLLETTDMRIADISIETGFKEDKHFIKTFKAIAGITPGQYRSKIT